MHNQEADIKTDERFRLKDKKKIVVKVGTSSLTHSNGSINFSRIEKLAKVLSEIRFGGRQVVLVTSGAIAVGAGKLNLTEKPKRLAEKQALAAIGQAELMNIYAKYFDIFNQNVAQVLLTKDVVINPVRRTNTKNTINSLLDMNIIPIINENDTVSTDEIEFGDNDTLSSHVAMVIEADLLIILSDIDGLYSADPRKDSNATIISTVYNVEDVEDVASGAGTRFSTGGMITKMTAARNCTRSNIDMIIAAGDDPEIIFKILEGKNIGTLFVANESNEDESPWSLKNLM